MILTRRGQAVAAVVVASVVMAALYGPRSLNAIVAPGVVALAAAVALVKRLSQPEVERVAPEDDFVGATKTVRLALSSPASFTAHVVDEVDDGLAATGNELTTTIDDADVTYEVAYERRGEHAIGPATLVARDVLGLARRTFRYPNEHVVLVYPRIYDLTGGARHALNTLPEYRLVDMRGEFDALREYDRGDALRDIHWKSSAKRADDELVVKEYVDEDDLGAIHIVAEAAGGRGAADAMAEAAASVASFLLAAGLTVGVSAPEGVVEPAEGSLQRRRILELLARTGPGTVPTAESGDADIHVRAGADGGVAVTIGDREVPFDRLVGTRGPATEEGADAAVAATPAAPGE